MHTSLLNRIKALERQAVAGDNVIYFMDDLGSCIRLEDVTNKHEQNFADISDAMAYIEAQKYRQTIIFANETGVLD